MTARRVEVGHAHVEVVVDVIHIPTATTSRDRSSAPVAKTTYVSMGGRRASVERRSVRSRATSPFISSHLLSATPGSVKVLLGELETILRPRRRALGLIDERNPQINPGRACFHSDVTAHIECSLKRLLT